MSIERRRRTRLLPLDERGHRVVAQVLADWRFEASSARTRSRRWLTHARYLGAVTEAMTVSAARTTLRAPLAGLITTSFLYLLSFYALAILVPSSVSGRVRHLPAENWLPLLVPLFASYAATFLPVAAFLSALRGSVRDWARRDWLIACTGGFVGLVAFIGWILPDLNQAFRELAFQATGGSGAITRGPAELTFSDLIADGSPQALASLAARVALAATLPLALFLASRVTPWTVTALVLNSTLSSAS